MFIFVRIIFVSTFLLFLLKMSKKVIIGLPFIAILYPFSVDEIGVSMIKMGVSVKFHFACRFDIDVSRLSLISGKTMHLNFLKQEVKYKKIAEQLYVKLLQSKITAFNNLIITLSFLNFLMPFGVGKNILSLYLTLKIFERIKSLLKLDPSNEYLDFRILPERNC